MSQLGFADLGMAAPNARRDRLGQIEKAIDWMPVAALLAGLRQPGGRPPYESLAIAANALRLDLVAIAYNLRRAVDLAA